MAKRWYVGLSKGLSKALLKNHQAFARSTKFGIHRWLGRAAHAVSAVGGIGGLAAQAASNVVTGTKRVSRSMDLWDMPTTKKRERKFLPNFVGRKKQKRMDHTAVEERRYDKQHAGQRISSRRKQQKMLAAHLQTWISRFNACDADGLDAGWFSLSYNGTAPAAGQTSQYGMPLYLFDLTCVENFINPNTQYPCLSRRLVRQVANADIAIPANQPFKTVLVGGQDKDNSAVATPCWQLERRPGDFDPTVGARAMIEWIDIRLQITGAKKAPSKVWVEIWRFKDEGLCPTMGYNTTSRNGQLSLAAYETAQAHLEPQPGGLDDYDRWQDFWISETDGLIGNTLSKRGQVKTSDVCARMYSKCYEFTPTLTIENDTTGHQVQVRLFYDVNKIHSYDVGGVAYKDVGVTDQANANFWDESGSTLNSIIPNGKGRKFLVIRGTCAKNITGLTAGDYDPSFDIIIRRKMSRLHT